MPRAGTGDRDSMGPFCRYRCSALFNYDCNLSMCGTFLQKWLPLQDSCGLLPTPQEAYGNELECNYCENSVISNPIIDFLNQ